MGVGISVALDREVAGVTPEGFEGYALNQARWELSEAAEEAGLRPLDEFVSLSPEESEILASDLNFDSDVDAVTPAGWFEAHDGLRLVQTLLATVSADPDAFPGEDTLLTELTELEAVLSAAARAGARFRLSVAY
ncbi:MAG: hypothetical protein F4Y20_03460 [Acidobacteria bacterium]|nr:hypothetical protein [Acidobacteriota bacterium]MYK79978.1 hypothetical protein [Acidobacteriota bacterium]